MEALEARRFTEVNRAAFAQHAARSAGEDGSDGAGAIEAGAISVQIDDRRVWVLPPHVDVHEGGGARSEWCASYGLFDRANCEMLVSAFE